MMGPPLLFLMLNLGISRVYCGIHSLRYYYTAVSAPGYGLPEFSAAGYVDETQIDKYDSYSHRDRPMTQWMERNEGPEYWDQETQVIKGTEAVYKHNVRTAMERFNQTTGFHSFQNIYGCELREDGSTRGYDQYGYDGRDFIYLDTDRWRYVPNVHEAQITEQKWNSPEVNAPERDKNYLENICTEYLRKYIEYGREELERRVHPKVKVSDHQSDTVTKLRCQVYGFYPRDVDVKWVKNGADDVYSEEAKQILPNPDGTYQIRVTVEVTPKEGDSYACHVDHSSLEKPLIVLWEPKKYSSLSIIIAVVAVVIVLVIAVVGRVVYKKRTGKPKASYMQAAHNDSPPSSVSGEPLKV
ncbi:class I histocompatibility antigen, F10 alpha chain-like [Rhinophrynus dorsalis]